MSHTPIIPPNVKLLRHRATRGQDRRDRQDHARTSPALTATYKYRIEDEAAKIDYEATDLPLDARDQPNNTKALETLTNALIASAAAFDAGHVIEADWFPEEVNVWTHDHAPEILSAFMELGGGLEL